MRTVSAKSGCHFLTPIRPWHYVCSSDGKPHIATLAIRLPYGSKSDKNARTVSDEISRFSTGVIYYTVTNSGFISWRRVIPGSRLVILEERFDDLE